MAQNVGNKNSEALFHLVDAVERVNFPDSAAEQVATDGDSYIKTIAKRFFKNKVAVISLVIFLILVLTAVFANQIAPHPRDASVGRFQAAPYDNFYLGTDDIGRDVLTRLIHGTQVSIIVGLGSVLVYVLIGTTLGLVSGYFGGFIDSIIMRITEAFMSFPFFMVILTLVSLLGSGIWVVTIVLGTLSWPPLCRLVRGQVLTIKEQDFVLAAVATGYSTPGILFRHILPNVLSPILVNATFGIATAILTEASLSFLGVGVQRPRPSWGNILSEAQSLRVLTSEPWRWVPAGILIFIAVLAINFIGDGLREAIEGETKS
ncbi:Oligopeptide transport system permease protein OppC [Alkalibacterium sp. AK22]|uniref:oligopeptide ABC transporter permease n=1 Tax=Alkalibacterium sp. AK22 TaxID=1229520 RepID=UPI00044B4686|nr:oligopeptide ABC transporter permease [Alkalibacterium sp. AK22]EXJ24052.1 Oligopeptide transport system permease protein OppC [Alkalibacterium sp. AK22]